MRDTRKSKEYFEEYINDQLEGITTFKKSFKASNDSEIKEEYCELIIEFYIDLISSFYSKGATKEELKSLLIELLPYFEYVEFYDAYVEALWILSLCYLLEIDSSKLEFLKKRIKENEYDDFVVSSILNTIFKEEKIKTNINWKRPYAKLISVLEQKEKADIKVLENYLKKSWYTGHSDSAWYDTHKRKNNAYAGYWSFESAAIVKMFGLDDSSLKGIDYYPYDLVRM